jgi:hypothetical protein
MTEMWFEWLSVTCKKEASSCSLLCRRRLRLFLRGRACNHSTVHVTQLLLPLTVLATLSCSEPALGLLPEAVANPNAAILPLLLLLLFLFNRLLGAARRCRGTSSSGSRTCSRGLAAATCTSSSRSGRAVSAVSLALAALQRSVTACRCSWAPCWLS